MQFGATPSNNLTRIEKLSNAAKKIVGTALPFNKKGPLTIPVNEPVEWALQDLNL